MPLQATSGAASYDAFGGGVPVIPNYIEEVFSTWLYTGNSSTQTVTNGIDLSGKGGLVWIKNRQTTIGVPIGHILTDTARGATRFLRSQSTSAQETSASSITAFNSSGFSFGSDTNINYSGDTYASWTFREQPKFFDVVTWTSTTTTNTNLRVSHNLGSVPGCIIIKATSTTDSWYVYHRELGINQYVRLNATSAAVTNTPSWGTSNPTSTDFGFNENLFVASAPTTFVAYIFAHNAGGFGLSGTDNVISCGSFTTNGSSAATVTLGYEPQWILTKRTDGTGAWGIYDTMRGWSFSGQNFLLPNSSGAEGVINAANFVPTATGFTISAPYDASATYIYIAIRRGPMRTPTTGTSVYSPQTSTGVQTTNFVVDAFIGVNQRASPGSFDPFEKSRLQGGVPYLTTSSTAAEASGSNVGFDSNTGVTLSWSAGGVNWYFRRAPSVFDEVCYTGTGSASQTFTHNLGVAPELIIVKCRNDTTAWESLGTALSSSQRQIYLNRTAAGVAVASGHLGWNGTDGAYKAPTSSVVYFGGDSDVGGSGLNYVAYLFATCAGVSKVGTYTGTGTTQTINCGFTAGSRFVLIKRTDSTGDWYVWDSARGIVAGNDPYLLLNSTAAEVTNTDFIDTASTGFEISSTAPAAINASGGTFIFLAIA